MKLKKITINSFKRFTHLTVQKIPEKTRLIMLAGPNGCGKSSFFDALKTWHSWKGRKHPLWENDYHRKVGSELTVHKPSDAVEVQFYDLSPDEPVESIKKSFYFRSAYRNESEFEVRRFERSVDLLDETRIMRMIDEDRTVSRNYQRIVSGATRDIFKIREQSQETVAEFRDGRIGEISEPFSKLFHDIELNDLGDPFQDGSFYFAKGISKRFSFKNLSGGEKAAFDLILDIVVAKQKYDNTVFCIDEPESHINPQLQAKLLSVLYDLVPENCQLVLATHSIGMMRRARDIERRYPETVVFLNFGGQNFDERQTVEPCKPDRKFWEETHKIALDDLAALVAPSQVVICEGHPKTKGSVANHSMDARCYNRIFEDNFPETRFISMGSDQQIIGDQRGLAEALSLLISGLNIVRLVDRDDRSNEEIKTLREQGIRVLSRRNIESYLFDDEVLKKLATQNEREDRTGELLEKKRKILASKDGSPQNDLKTASGEIYNACKSILGLTACGNNAKAFMRDTLTPLIKPGMAVYEELKRDIFNI